MTNVVSHLCGFADTTNTGFQGDEADLTRVPDDQDSGTGWHWDSRGWVQIDSNNAVLDGFFFTSNVNVQDASNVHIVNSVFEVGGDTWAISLRNADSFEFTDSTIRGTEKLGPNRLDNAIRDINGGANNSDPITIKRVNIYWASTCVNHVTGGGLIEYLYCHDPGYNTVTDLDHTNGIQSEGSNGSLLTIRKSTILNDRVQADAIMLSGIEGDQNNKIVEDNLLAGGGYSLYGRGSSSEGATNIRARRNHFSRIFFPNGGFFGPNVYWDSDGIGNVWEDNIWDDTGATVSPAS